MQSKTRWILWILAAMLLAGLAVVSMWARNLGFEDVLLITPSSSNSSTVSAEGLEDINGDQFLLTYEIISSETMRALNANFEVILRKTNYSYHYLMDYKMLSGSFFTEEDQKRKQKAAVLNKAAAYAMFGGIDVRGLKIFLGREEYTVAGVIDDRDVNAGGDGIEDQYNVYIPAAVSGQNPQSFAVKLNDDLTLAKVKNKCKDLTVPQSGYQYIHFGMLADLVYGMLLIAVKMSLIAVFLVLCLKNIERLKANIKQLGTMREQYYSKEILFSNPEIVMKTAASAAIVLLTILLILSIAVRFIDYYLFWGDSAAIRAEGDVSAFGEIASALQRDFDLSAALLAGFIIVLVLLLSQSYRKKHILYQ